MDTSERILWMSGSAIPQALQQAAAGRWAVLAVTADGPLETDGAIVAVGDAQALDARRNALAAAGIVPLLLTEEPSASVEPSGSFAEPQLHLPPDASEEEWRGMLSAATTLGPSLRQMKLVLGKAEALAKEAARTADEIDDEMRLASRLQQDFLPRRLPVVGPVRFGVLYRPASWVSGDIFDVVRLDETHVGFYIADAVGHGMPAALMTMFIKEALQTKRIQGETYEIIPPHQALAALNADLCRQKLSRCEFCTAVYGVIDTETLEVSLCRAGHPAPILMPADGEVRTLDFPGSLLGILEGAEYTSGEFTLAPGDRLLLYSDGVEDVLCGRGKGSTVELAEVVAPLASLSRQEFLTQLTERVSGPDVEDDVTVLLLEVQQRMVHAGNNPAGQFNTQKESMENNTKQRRPIWLIAMFLAWLVPGAGHVYIGRRWRGIIIFVTIAATFWTGVAIGGVMTVDSRYEKWWFYGQMITGVHGLVGWYRQEQVYKELDEDPDVILALKARAARAAEENEMRRKRGFRPLPLPPEKIGPFGGRPDDVHMTVTKKLAAKGIAPKGIALDEPASGVAYAFSGVAGMLNLMVIFDAVMLTLMGMGAETALRRKKENASEEGDAS